LTGKYLVVDSKEGQYGDIAEIATPYFPESEPSEECHLTFWYYMFHTFQPGETIDGMGTLRVYTQGD
jgi:hypothetical protein